MRLSPRLRRESVAPAPRAAGRPQATGERECVCSSQVLRPRRRVCGATQGRLRAALHRAALCRRARHEHLHARAHTAPHLLRHPSSPHRGERAPPRSPPDKLFPLGRQVAPASHLAARGGPRGAGRARRPAGQQDPRVRCAARATPSPLPSSRRPAPRRLPTLSSRRKATPAWARWLPSRTSSRPLFACWRSTWRRKSAPEERGSRFLRRDA